VEVTPLGVKFEMPAVNLSNAARELSRVASIASRLACVLSTEGETVASQFHTTRS
jgi:hypothetical protein